MSLAVLGLCALAAIAWLAVDHGSGADPIRVLAASGDRLVGASAQAPGAATAVAAAAVAPGGERDPALIDVCGLGWVEPKADGGGIDPALIAGIPGIETSAESIAEGLRRSPDAFARATATVLEMDSDSARLEPLAREATTTEDGRLYALAFRACGRTPTTGSCALLNAGQWARLDEGNGEPWLFMLEDAALRDDRAMVDEALYRIGSAARFDDRPHALAGAIIAQAGTSDPDLMAAQALAIAVIGFTAALPLPLQRLTSVCGGAALNDANRRQLCEGVAAALAERTDSLLLASIGTAIGQRVGWAGERIVAVRALMLAQADSWSAVPDVTAIGQSYSCTGVRAVLARFGQLAQVGELQAARDWIAASGKTFESFAGVAREQEARRSAAATEEAERSSVAAAASAASAARRGG